MVKADRTAFCMEIHDAVEKTKYADVIDADSSIIGLGILPPSKNGHEDCCRSLEEKQGH